MELTIKTEEALNEEQAQRGSLRCSGMVGGRPRSRAKLNALVAMSAAMAWSGGPNIAAMLAHAPERERPKTAADYERIEAARLKRERKAMKKSARTTTPNDGHEPRPSNHPRV